MQRIQTTLRFLSRFFWGGWVCFLSNHPGRTYRHRETTAIGTDWDTHSPTDIVLCSRAFTFAWLNPTELTFLNNHMYTQKPCTLAAQNSSLSLSLSLPRTHTNSGTSTLSETCSKQRTYFARTYKIIVHLG